MRSWQEQNEGLDTQRCYLTSEGRDVVKGGGGVGFILQTSDAVSLEFDQRYERYW